MRTYTLIRPMTLSEWGTIVRMFERIRHMAAVGLTGPAGRGAPVVDRRCIAFRGEGGGRFELSRDGARGGADTDGRPVDAVAAAVLVAAHRLAPGALALGPGCWAEGERIVDCLSGMPRRRRAQRLEVVG